MQRRLRLAILVGLVLAGGAIALAGAKPQGYRTVAEVVAEPTSFAGREVHLKASVVEGSLRRDAVPLTFDVADGASVLEVRWNPAHPLPDHEAGGTIEGKSVVVRGIFAHGPEGSYLVADEMTVGCASKYRPADEAEVSSAGS